MKFNMFKKLDPMLFLFGIPLIIYGASIIYYDIEAASERKTLIAENKAQIKENCAALVGLGQRIGVSSFCAENGALIEIAPEN